MTATARTSERHTRGETSNPCDLAHGPGDAWKVTKLGLKAARSRGRVFAKRSAKAAFAQSSRVETANTTTKSAALAASPVQNTPT